MRIAINQPYFIPYAGYFRLFHEIDLFVIYDDVQFPYPGYVHRNQLTTRKNLTDWFTIPLKHKPLATEIKDIEFAEGHVDRWRKARARYKVFEQRPLSALAQKVSLIEMHPTPSDFIISTLRATLDILGLETEIVKSSRYKWSMFNRGQERVIEMCKKFGASEYVNASGGVTLYDPLAFSDKKIKLKILQPYKGSKASILERLASENWRELRREIELNYEFIS